MIWHEMVYGGFWWYEVSWIDDMIYDLRTFIVKVGSTNEIVRWHEVVWVTMSCHGLMI